MSCTICEIEDVKCEFANIMSSIVNEMKFGISSCCSQDFDKTEVKLRLAEFSLIQDVDTDYIIEDQPVIISPVSLGDCCK